MEACEEIETMAELRYLADVVTLELSAEKCIGCGLCAEVCPHAVLAVTDGKAAIVDRLLAGRG